LEDEIEDLEEINARMKSIDNSFEEYHSNNNNPMQGMKYVSAFKSLSQKKNDLVLSNIDSSYNSTTN